MPDPRPLTPPTAEPQGHAVESDAWGRYAWAFGTVVAATLLTFALRNALGWEHVRIVFIFSFPAVLLTAMRGGRGPAILAIALSAFIGNYIFLPPFYALSLTYEGVLQTGLFLLVASMLVYLTQRSRRAEADARRSEESLSITLSSIGDAVIATDGEGRVNFLNAVAERLTGWSAAEARGRPLAEVFRILNEDTREEIESPVAKVLRDGVTVGLANHTVLVARDGRETPIDDSAAPIKDAGGRTTGVVLVFHDITERREAEVARERLAAIVESSADAIIGKTLAGVITSWNASAEGLYGHTAAEAIGRPISLVVPAERAGEISDILARIGRGERVEHLETVRVRKDGSRVEVAITVSPVSDEEGRVVGASTIARDISARRRHEQERARLTRLVDAERLRLRNLVGEVPGVVWEAWGAPDESSQRINFVSDYVERMLGYTVEEWLAEPNFWLRIVHPDDREQAAAAARTKFESREGGASEFRWVAKDGRVVHVEAYSVPVFDEAGRPVGMRGVTMDVTARRRAEEALSASEELSQAVLNSLHAHIAVLDREGRIVAVNEAWRRFSAENGGAALTTDVGVNYLTVCGAAAGGADDAGDILEGVAAVLEGRRRSFEAEYPCHSPEEERWFLLTATPLPGGRGGAVVSHIIITDRKRAEAQLERRAAQAALGADVGVALAESGAPLRRTLQRCVEAVVRHLDAAFARVWTLNPEEDVLELQASAGMYTHLDGPHGRVPVGKFKIGLIAEERRPHLTNDVPNDPRVGDKEWAAREGMIAFAGYPLLLKDRLVGVMAMFARRPLSDVTLQAMASVADGIAVGIERKQAEAELRASELRYRALTDAMPQLQPPLVRVHRPQRGRVARLRLHQRAPPGRQGAHPRALGARVARGRGLRD
jgi:PAS domain S-box-containing protein